MKLINLNKYGNEIVYRLANRISTKYFTNLEISVGLFISSKYYAPTILGKPIHACTIRKENLETAANTFSFLEELGKIKTGTFENIIWLDSHIDTRDDKNEIIAHELKHVEQMVHFPEIISKSEAIDILFSSLKDIELIAPHEKDAKNFERLVVGQQEEFPKYDWKTDTSLLFKKYKECLKDFLQGCKNPNKGVIVKISETQRIDTKLFNDSLLKWIIKILERSLKNSHYLESIIAIFCPHP